MSEMVERVAEAVAKCRIDGYGTDEDIARAAIAAMREPTEAMTMEGFEHTGDPCWPHNVRLAWQAMIDAALAD